VVLSSKLDKAVWMKPEKIKDQLKKIGGFATKDVELAWTDRSLAFAYFEGTQGMLNALMASYEKSVKVEGCLLTVSLCKEQNRKEYVAYGGADETARLLTTNIK